MKKWYSIFVLLTMLFYSEVSAQCNMISSAIALKSCLENPPYTATIVANIDLTGTTITIPNNVTAVVNLGAYDITWTGAPWAFGNPGVNTNLVFNTNGGSATVVKNSATSSQVTLADFNNGGSVSSALPITLADFSARTATIGGRKVIILNFSTLQESNNAFFDIERSSNGYEFETISQVNGAGNSLLERHYTVEDAKPLAGLNYYRLRQVDHDGKFSFSKIIKANNATSQDILVYPTQVNDLLTIVTEKGFSENTAWQIIDPAGRLVQEGLLLSEQPNQQIALIDLDGGIYFLRIMSDSRLWTKQIHK
jgi:hypothetical protein